jgi:hypothetical protein
MESVLWLPDSHLLFSRKEGNSHRLMERTAEGGVENERARVDALGSLQDVSPDGKVVLYHAGPNLYSMRLDDATAKPQMVAKSVQGKFSPDGRWVYLLRWNGPSK